MESFFLHLPIDVIIHGVSEFLSPHDVLYLSTACLRLRNNFRLFDEKVWMPRCLRLWSSDDQCDNVALPFERLVEEIRDSSTYERHQRLLCAGNDVHHFLSLFQCTSTTKYIDTQEDEADCIRPLLTKKALRQYAAIAKSSLTLVQREEASRKIQEKREFRSGRPKELTIEGDHDEDAACWLQREADRASSGCQSDITLWSTSNGSLEKEFNHEYQQLLLHEQQHQQELENLMKTLKNERNSRRSQRNDCATDRLSTLDLSLPKVPQKSCRSVSPTLRWSDLSKTTQKLVVSHQGWSPMCQTSKNRSKSSRSVVSLQSLVTSRSSLPAHDHAAAAAIIGTHTHSHAKTSLARSGAASLNSTAGYTPSKDMSCLSSEFRRNDPDIFENSCLDSLTSSSDTYSSDDDSSESSCDEDDVTINLVHPIPRCRSVIKTRPPLAKRSVRIAEDFIKQQEARTLEQAHKRAKEMVASATVPKEVAMAVSAKSCGSCTAPTEVVQQVLLEHPRLLHDAATTIEGRMGLINPHTRLSGNEMVAPKAKLAAAAANTGSLVEWLDGAMSALPVTSIVSACSIISATDIRLKNLARAHFSGTERLIFSSSEVVESFATMPMQKMRRQVGRWKFSFVSSIRDASQCLISKEEILQISWRLETKMNTHFGHIISFDTDGLARSGSLAPIPYQVLGGGSEVALGAHKFSVRRTRNNIVSFKTTSGRESDIWSWELVCPTVRIISTQMPRPEYIGDVL